jgi:hypothetical protein
MKEMDSYTLLYIELYVSFLLAVIVYVLMELFKVEKEQTPSGDVRQPIKFPRYSVWLVGIGMFLVVAGWLTSFGLNEGVKYYLASAAEKKLKAETAGTDAAKTKTAETDGAKADTISPEEAEAIRLASIKYEDGIILAAEYFFYPGVVLVAISLLIFGYCAAIHPRLPAWFNLAGIITIGIGLFAFCASAAVGCVVRSIHSFTTPVPEVVLRTGLLNPFFLVGIPLGFYWMYRSKKLSAPRSEKGGRREKSGRNS